MKKFTKKLASPFDSFLPGIAFHAYAVSNLLQNNAYNESLLTASIFLHLLFLILFVFLFEQRIRQRPYIIAVIFAFILAGEFIFFSFLDYEFNFASFLLPFFFLVLSEIGFTILERNSLFETTISESEALKHLLTKKEHELFELKKHSSSSSSRERENLIEKIELLQKEIARIGKEDQNDLLYTVQTDEKSSDNFYGILYRSKVMREVVSFIKKAAPTNETVLILFLKDKNIFDQVFQIVFLILDRMRCLQIMLASPML